MAVLEEPVRGKRLYPVGRRRPANVERVSAGLLLVLDQQVMHAGLERDHSDCPVHLIRRVAAQHHRAIDIKGQPVVASPMDLQQTAVRHVPIAAPPDAEALAETVVIVQEMEGDAFADFLTERPPGEAVREDELPPQPGPLSRLRSKQQPRRRARQGGCRVSAHSPACPTAAW